MRKWELLSLPFPTPISRHRPKTAVEGSSAGAWQEVPLPAPQFLSINPIHLSSACPQILSFSHALGSWLRADGAEKTDSSIRPPKAPSFHPGMSLSLTVERVPQLTEIYQLPFHFHCSLGVRTLSPASIWGPHGELPVLDSQSQSDNRPANTHAPPGVCMLTHPP